MGACTGWGGFERNKGGSREKWRSFERKSACIFEWSGEGEENYLSCLFVLGLFCVVRLLFDLVLLLFRDGLLFFDPGCPVSTPSFPF